MSKRICSHWSRLVFDGDEKNYELWETKFLGHMQLQKLKDTSLKGPSVGASADARAEDTAKNAEAYAELIQFTDDKVCPWSCERLRMTAVEHSRSCGTIMLAEVSPAL